MFGIKGIEWAAKGERLENDIKKRLDKAKNAHR